MCLFLENVFCVNYLYQGQNKEMKISVETAHPYLITHQKHAKAPTKIKHFVFGFGYFNSTSASGGNFEILTNNFLAPWSELFLLSLTFSIH